MEVARDIWDRQQPLIVQPIWKMSGNKLADDCLDVFVCNSIWLCCICAMRKKAEEKEKYQDFKGL